MSTSLNPLDNQQLTALENLSEKLTREQIVWIDGYFQGLLAASVKNIEQSAKLQQPLNKQLKVLFGTHTGKSKLLALNLAEKLTSRGVAVSICALDEYKTRQLTSESNVVFIVSTHGEGEPPTMAEDFHNFITGKRSPELPGLNYSVVALGDKSYRFFCKTGIDIDSALSKSGAKKILPVLTLDVDYEEEADQWIHQFAEIFAENSEDSFPSAILNDLPVKTTSFSRKNPYKAIVLEKVKITGRDSDKEVYHVELSIKGSGIAYEPGDSVGILANNPPELVEAILKQLNFEGREEVVVKSETFSLREALYNQLEITILTREVLHKYQEKTGNTELLNLLNNEELLGQYLYGHDVLDLLHEFPANLTPQELAEFLRNFPPRLYSISSSQAAVGDEIHITVSTVRYNYKDRDRSGACSTYLADRIDLDSQVSIFIERNPAFKLPEDENTPMILIGAGTGVAPYRAFLQHREANEQKGNTWLFFGERRFHSDFLYQLEWQKLLKNGYLERFDVAFSRDQEKKVYVQNRLAENQQEIFEWLENGANIYLCGDMKQMAHDVQDTLLHIIEYEGGMSREKSLDYLKRLKKEMRFQVDVY